jgi:hypothetical protein
MRMTVQTWQLLQISDEVSFWGLCLYCILIEVPIFVHPIQLCLYVMKYHDIGEKKSRIYNVKYHVFIT